MHYLSVFLILQLLTFLICRPLRISSWDKELSIAAISLVTKALLLLALTDPFKLIPRKSWSVVYHRKRLWFTKLRNIIRTKETLFLSDVIKIFREASKGMGHLLQCIKATYSALWAAPLPLNSRVRYAKRWAQSQPGCCRRKSRQSLWAPCANNNIKQGANNVHFKTTVQNNGKAAPCTASAVLVICWKQQKQREIHRSIDSETIIKMRETQNSGLPAGAWLYWNTLSFLG